jgi:hypothetical protein
MGAPRALPCHPEASRRHEEDRRKDPNRAKGVRDAPTLGQNPPGVPKRLQLTGPDAPLDSADILIGVRGRQAGYATRD